MGAWQGIYMGRQAIKDAAKEARDEKIEAEKLEMLREEFIEGKRKTRLDALIAFKQARVNDPTEKAMRTTLRNLKSMTLPNDVASYLAASGEGDQIFEVWKSRRGKDLSDKWLPSLIERVRLELGDEDSPAAKAMAVKVAVLSDEDQSTPEGQAAVLAESLFEINSTTGFKAFDEKLTKLLMEPPRTTLPMPTIGGLTRGSEEVNPTLLSQIQKAVIERLAPKFGNIYISDEGGLPIINPEKSGAGVLKIRDLYDKTISDITNDLQGVNRLSFDDALNKNIAIAKQTDLGLNPPPELIVPNNNNNNSDTTKPFVQLEPPDPYGIVTGERED